MITPENRRVSIDAVLQYVSAPPVKTTRGRGWSGITVDVQGAVPDFSIATPGRDHHLICYCLQGRGNMVQRRAGIVDVGSTSVGMFGLTPAGYESTWEGDHPATVRMRIPTDFILQGADEIGVRTRASVEMINVFRQRDPVIETISKLFSAELDRPSHPAQSIIVESHSCALVAHLLRRYNSHDLPAPNRQNGLDPDVLARVLEFIEDNVEQPILLADLAAIAGVSRFHFVRLFHRSTGISPIAYVEQSRIRRAQEYLRSGELTIAEVALAVGFCDQSGFTRRFHRHVGMTPAAFVKESGIRKLPRRAR